MKRNCLIALMFLATAGFAAAQAGPPTTDVLGAHLNYGRGCVACHAPHSGAFGNGYKPTGDVANTGTIALWGEDVSGLLGQTLVFGRMDNGATYSTTLASSVTAALNGDPTVTGVLMCLSCHDGNYATGAMMKNTTYEKITSGTVGGNAIPTLLGNDGTGTGNYLNDHPVGTNAVMGCGGQYNWDCTITGSSVAMTGPNSTAFVKNYGFFVKPASYTTTGTTPTTKPIVVCTTCHNQHLMNVVNVTAKNSGMTPGYYQTMFFLVGPYNPNSTTAGSNQTAQFCRQCHGGEANESNGTYAIPTTF